MFACRPPKFEKKSFFERMSSSLSLIVNHCENIIVNGDLNINFLNAISETRNYFSDMRETFALTKLVKEKTCSKNTSRTLLDVVLTNILNFFQKTFVSENSPI